MKSRAARHALLVALGAVLALVAFELVLQIIAFATWRWHGARAELPAGATRAVLCVGDSLTWGAEASSAAASYPAQLQVLLREAGRGDVAVANGGWPGRTSALVLERLGAQLDRWAPELVYVLVGYNDGWDRPREVLETGETESFLLVCRTARFAALVASWLRGDRRQESPAVNGDGTAAPVAQRAAAAELVGTWHDRSDGHELVIESDGRFAMRGVALRWSLEDGRLWLDGPDVGRFPVAWERAGSGLVLRAERWEHRYDPGPPPPALRRLAAAGAALLQQQWQVAADGFTACLADPSVEIPARGGLVQALARLDPGAAEPHLEVLQRAWRAQPDRATATALADGLRALGRDAAAFAVACEQLARSGSGTGVWHVFTGADLSAEQGRRAVQALRAAVAVESDASAPERAIVLRALAAAVVGTDPVDAVRCLLRATALDGVAGPLAETIAHHAAVVTRERYAALVDEVEPDAATAARMRALGAAAFGDAPPDAVADTVLVRHLWRIVEHCRRNGAEPVLLDYPVPVPEVEAAVAQVAAALGVGRVAVRAAFDRELQSRPRAELIARDGLHCVDQGYALIARLVAADALRRLR